MVDQRTERVVVETDRHSITGTLRLPKEGYRSRLSDYLNQGDTRFLPLVDVTVRLLAGGEEERAEFIAVNLSQVRLIHPVERD